MDHDNVPLCRLLLLLLMLVTSSLGMAQETVEMLHWNWNSRDGLPQDHIRAITRTRDGFLWLATDSGLARFDGRSFKCYGLREGLGAVTVLSLLEADDGTLWVATQGGGVSMLRDGVIQKTYPEIRDFPLTVPPTLCQDGAGAIWVAGAFRLEGDRFVPGPGNPTPVRQVIRDHEGAMWVITQGNKLLRWKNGSRDSVADGGPDMVDAILEDTQGRFWAADTQRQLWMRKDGVWQSWSLPDSVKQRVSSLTVAPDGTLWLATFRESILGFRDGKFYQPRIREESFFDLAEIVSATPDGLLWIGTSTNGLYSLRPSRLTLATLNDDHGNRGMNFIGALMETSPGEFMVGTQSYGLFRWAHETTHEIESFRDKNSGLIVNSLIPGAKGNIWAGADRGLYLFRNESDKVSEFSIKNIWELQSDGEELWIGRGNGELLHRNDRNGKTVAVDYGGDTSAGIRVLRKASDGTLWIGTRGNGLFQLKNGVSRHFGRDDGLISEVIRVVTIDPEDGIWVGTSGGGLSFGRNGRFHTITSSEGLPDDTVSQITFDQQGRLWVGTHRGLAVISQKELHMWKNGSLARIQPLWINRSDGFVSEECTIVPPVHMSDGRIAFATTHGFAMLRPENFLADETTPPVCIETIRADGKVLLPSHGQLKLPAGTHRLEIEFTGLHFSAPSQLRFRNRLEGLEQDWGEPSFERRVEYRNLTPGTYRFELAGSIGNGLWTPQPASLDITLAPFFWQTSWFRSAVIVASLALAAASAFAFERARSSKKIETLRRERAVQAERARIARDLHDDVGASLTQVALLSELADSDLSESPEAVRGHINEIFTTAKNVTRSLDEIVWAVNPEQDTLERFAAFLGTYVQNYARTASLNVRLDIPERLPAITVFPDVRHHLFLATKEILHNIVKHAGATEVRMQIAPQAQDLLLVIGDDGQGLPQTPSKDGDGLANLRERLARIQGTCTLISSDGQGTIVEMRVPLAQ